MKVGVIAQNFYPQDRSIRIKKIIQSLNNNGYDVDVFCPNLPGNYSEEKLKNCYAFRLTKNLSYPFPFNLIWVYFILSKAKNVDLLLITNLRLFLPALISSKILRIPLIFDMPEYYVAMSKIRKRNFLERIFKHPWIVTKLERLAVKESNCIWVVVEEQKKRLLKLGAKNVKIISNVPILDPNFQNNVDKTWNKHEKLILLYIGIITEGRGLDIMIKAMNYLKHKNIRLLIVGDGSNKYSLEKLAVRFELNNKVKFLGWIEYESLENLIMECDIGLIPHRVSEFTNNTIPNKLFDYMKYGKPVLATNMIPVRKVIVEENCGIIIPENPKMIAKKLKDLNDNRAYLKKLGKNGKNAIINKYNWERESSKIVESIKYLVNRENNIYSA